MERTVGAMLEGAATVGERIRRLMKDQAVSLSDLHRSSGVAKGYLSELLRDAPEAVRRKPSAQTLHAIGTALGVSVAELLGHSTFDQEAKRWPPGLAEYVREHNVPPDDARVLAAISLRGKTPEQPDEWKHIHRTIQMYTSGTGATRP